MNSRVNGGLLVAAAALCMGCGGVQLAEAKFPTMDNAKSALKVDSNLVYSHNSTFANNPHDWLGRVGIMFRNEKGDCSPQNAINWNSGGYIRHPTPPTPGDGMDEKLGYPVITSVPRPQLRASIIIDSQTTASLDALNFVNGSYGASDALELVLTEQIGESVNAQDIRWDEALQAYQTANRERLIDNKVCYAVAIDRYEYLTLTQKVHHKVDGSANAGYAGVNVGGTYYTSGSNFTLEHVFGLNVVILKPLPTMSQGGGDTLRISPPNDSDRNFLRAALKN